MGEFIEELPPTDQRAATFGIDQFIPEKILSFEEASKGLSILGKDESGVRYAYLMLSVIDSQLTDVKIILNFKHILFLDVSGNYLKLDALQILTKMPFLIVLRADRNRVEAGALQPIPYLQVLALNSNHIQETLDFNQPSLEYLELNFNMIFTPQFDVERLSNLKQLELRGNQLMDISGTFPPTLEILYLPMNHIRKINTNDFNTLTNLKRLHLRDNKLKKLNGFSSNHSKLTYLNLRNNNITKLRQFRKLSCLINLETIIILDNPVCGVDTKDFKGEGVDDTVIEEEEMMGEDHIHFDPIRIGLLVLIPSLKRINKEIVSLEEREEAMRVANEKMIEIMKEESSDEETEPPTTTDLTTEYTTETEDAGLSIDEFI